jgi:hypothetical protein
MTKLLEEKSERVLKVADRCDSCSAQAYVLVKLVNGELMFCSHHYVKHSKKLNKSSYQIVDERHYISED